MTYPQNNGIVTAIEPGARIASVEPASPAARAGLLPGMQLVTVEGEKPLDILDWLWLADGFEVELEVVMPKEDASSHRPTAPQPQAPAPAQAEAKMPAPAEAPASVQAEMPAQAETPSPAEAPVQHITLTREPGEPWGLAFTSVLFDQLKSCANNCSFCFMKMLPPNMRPALSVRDDDYRLSFLHGNFVTLTNLSDAEVERIIDLHLSPLNVSLHAIDPEVRQQLMGRNHQRGLDVLETLLEKGIAVNIQIVLMPGVNDGAVLDGTLAWIARQPHIIATGIVPYGYTRYAKIQKGFDTPQSAREVIDQVAHLAPQVQLADEFFIKAWPKELLQHLPPADYYGEYPMREDGIGMVRFFLDEFEQSPLIIDEQSLLVTGESFAAVLHELLPQYARQVIAIKNEFFGGNVDVAGLLTAEDVVAQTLPVLKSQESPHRTTRLILPQAMFTDEGLTLDHKTATDIVAALGEGAKVLDFTYSVN